MKRVSLLLLLLWLPLALWACPTTTPTDEPTTDGGTTDKVSTDTTATALYTRYCSLCHGDKGEGYKADGANALANGHFLSIASDAFLRHAIVKGRPGTSMSAWGRDYGGPLTDKDADKLVALIRSWKSRAPVTLDHKKKLEGSPIRGKVQYELRCASCHGNKGQGTDTALSLNNPEFLATASDEFLRYSIAKGRPGTAMPAYEGKVTKQAILDLVALLRSWATPPDDKKKELPDKKLEPLMNFPDGAEPDFTSKDRFVAADTVKAALDKKQKFILLDARPPSDYVTDHITGAVSVPFYAVKEYLDQLPKEVWIVAYCACPHAESGKAWEALKAAGYTKIKVLNEGYRVWKQRGYTTKKGKKP